MPSLRLFLRAPLLIVWTLLCHLTIVASKVFRRLAPRWQLRIRNAAFRAWSLGFARIVGMRIVVEGTRPRGAFFLVSNHVGYMDIILLATRVDAAFVAKSELRAWPVLGRIFATADTIFIDRTRRRDVLRVMEAIGREIGRDLGVVIFPEGTSGKGDAILPFRPSLLDFAARREYPVHYASVSYSTSRDVGPAHELICWWGDAEFTPHAWELLRLPGFEARLVFGTEAVVDSNRKRLAEKLRSAVEDTFTPIE